MQGLSLLNSLMPRTSSCVSEAGSPHPVTRSVVVVAHEAACSVPLSVTALMGSTSNATRLSRWLVRFMVDAPSSVCLHGCSCRRRSDHSMCPPHGPAQEQATAQLTAQLIVRPCYAVASAASE